MPVTAAHHRARFAAAAMIVLGCAGRSESRGSATQPRAERFWSQPAAVIKLSFMTQLLAAITEEQKAWKAEEMRVHGEVQSGTSQRLLMLHCHVDGSFDGRAGRKPAKLYVVPTLIRSANQPVGVCPNWPPELDSTHGRSVALGGMVRASVRRPYPESLITGLDSAMRATPDDAWYLRQLVRVLTENGEHARARSVLATCTNDMWCYVLDGYVHYMQGNWPQANAAWADALSLMEPARRCQLLTTAELVPFRRDTVAFASCENRAPLDRNAWWLTKPLLSDSVNYRLVEHVARLVRNALVADLPRDAYYDLRPAAGGDAVQRMRLRYGWPAHAYWAGQKQDDGHQEYVRTRTSVPPAPPYLSPEYARDVVTTTPSMSAAQSPFTSQDSDFAVEPDTDDDEARPWPQEFFRHPNGVLLHIRTQQRAVLRRDTTALLVIAATLPVPRAAAGPDSIVHLQLLASAAPDRLRQAGATSTRWGSRAFISGELERPAVIGLEVNRGGARIAGARSRFGVPVVPSHATSPTGCALSEPILLDASALTTPGMEKLRRGMLSDLSLRRPQKLGLLWESYGVRSGDSVTLTVRVTGAQDRSGLARAVQSLGLVGQQEVAISVSWREPSPARQVEVIPAQVPTLQRDLTLDVASLRSGTYGVQVTMTSKGCTAASPVRSFSVAR